MDAGTEAAYIELCDAMIKQGRNIVGLAGNGRTEEATEAAINLVQTAMTAKHQYKMRQESVGTDRYDLGALRVDVNTVTNSETPFEDD